MKKSFTFLMLLFISSGIAFADMNEGFRDSNKYKKVTVAEALKMNDDSQVTVQGNITKKLSDDRYLLKDSTGTMTVEIDNDRWSGVSADTKDRLEICGEIEKKNNYTRLDADSVKKIAK